MKKTFVSIIAAIDKNRALGKDNKLLWHIPEDMKWFKSHTSGHPVIMGRKTFESIGKALPNRLNIVISRNLSYRAPGCTVAETLEKGIDIAVQSDNTEVFIIGGGTVYAQALPFADRLYLTIVDGLYDADTFFPQYDSFNSIIFKEEKQNSELKYTFLILEKQK
jgi:dihydrofolate reductase